MGDNDKARIRGARPGRSLQGKSLVAVRVEPMCVYGVDARNDEHDPISTRDRAIGASDEHRLTESCIPERQEHPGARVRVDVRIPAVSRTSRAWVHKRDMLRRGPSKAWTGDIALGIADRKRKIDPQARNDDA